MKNKKGPAIAGPFSSVLVCDCRGYRKSAAPADEAGPPGPPSATRKGCFLEAIERYALGPGSAGPRTLKEEPTARCAIERWLQEAADELTRPCHPKGCMVVMGP